MPVDRSRTPLRVVSTAAAPEPSPPDLVAPGVWEPWPPGHEPPAASAAEDVHAGAPRDRGVAAARTFRGTALSRRAWNDRLMPSTTAVAAWVLQRWSNSIEPYVQPPGLLCPRCAGGTGAVTLLTSRVTYFACGACEHRWSLERP